MSSAPLMRIDLAVSASGETPPWPFRYASYTRARIPATTGEEREVPDQSSLATAPFVGTTMFSGVAPTDIRPTARMSGSGRPRAVGPRLENGTMSPYDWLGPFSRPAQRR